MSSWSGMTVVERKDYLLNDCHTAFGKRQQRVHFIGRFTDDGLRGCSALTAALVSMWSKFTEPNSIIKPDYLANHESQIINPLVC